jgi:predicted amidohydrolase YtcJ
MDGRPADLVVRDTPIIVGDPAGALARFLAVRDGRVLAVGYHDRTRVFAGPDTVEIANPAGAVLPGFVDPHLHFASLVRLGQPTAGPTADGLARRLRRERRQTPPGAWVFLPGYDGDFDALTRSALDRLVPDRPAAVRHATGHAAVLNSLALRALGWTARYPDGRIVGRLDDIARAAPPGPGPSETAVRKAARTLLSRGVTAFLDATATNGPVDWGRLADWHARGLIPQRIGMLFGPDRVDVTWLDRLSAGRRFGLKVVLEPAGLDEAARRALTDAAALARAARRPLAVHVPDLETLVFALDVLGTLPRRPYVRLEHVGVCPPSLAPDVARVADAVVTQPGFLYWRGDGYRRRVERALWPWLYPSATLLGAGIRLAVSSDAPVAPADPLRSLSALVRRVTRSGAALGPPTPVPAVTLLALATREAAVVAGLEAGRLVPGAPGDLVEVEPNPLALPPPEWDQIRIRRVFLAGRPVETD